MRKTKYILLLIIICISATYIFLIGDTNWNNKKANALGDSITAKTHHSEKSYHEYVKENLELLEYKNYGVSRSTIAKKDNDDSMAMCVRYNEMDNDADLITIAGGINDLGWSIPLGTIDSEDERTFYGALNVLCKGLKAKYPKKKIVFLTPTKQYNYFKEPNLVNNTLDDYCNAIKAVCEKYDIDVFDNNKFSGINPVEDENRENYTTDGLHWNINGHEKVGNILSDYLKS